MARTAMRPNATLRNADELEAGEAEVLLLNIFFVEEIKGSGIEL